MDWRKADWMERAIWVGLWLNFGSLIADAWRGHLVMALINGGCVLYLLAVLQRRI